MTPEVTEALRKFDLYGVVYTSVEDAKLISQSLRSLDAEVVELRRDMERLEKLGEPVFRNGLMDRRITYTLAGMRDIIDRAWANELSAQAAMAQKGGGE